MNAKHEQVADLVRQAYEESSQDFAHWVWKNHLPFVAEKAKELSKQFGANEDLAVAGAWLHDFGDAFVDRHDPSHGETTEREVIRVMHDAGYDEDEITTVIEQVLKPHSCRDGNLPETMEGKVMATADALAHLSTDFYLQFAWMHLPTDKTFVEFLDWVNEKIERDFHKKIFFDEVREQVRERYQSLQNVFQK